MQGNVSVTAKCASQSQRLDERRMCKRAAIENKLHKRNKVATQTTQKQGSFAKVFPESRG